MTNLTSSPRVRADERGLLQEDLSGKVIGVFYEVYNELGHGFLETIYGQALSVALVDKNLASHAK